MKINNYTYLNIIDYQLYIVGFGHKIKINKKNLSV